MDIVKFKNEIQNIENILSNIENGKVSLLSILDFFNNPELSQEARDIGIAVVREKLPGLVPAFQSVSDFISNQA